MHNGIIENYLDLKQDLQRRGHRFVTETDTEVVAHLVEKHLKNGAAKNLEEAVRLFCKEGRLVTLLADLSVHRLDMVIADRAIPTDVKVRAYNHLLGSSDVTVFGAEALAHDLGP